MSAWVMADFAAPSVAYVLVLPMLVVFGGALLGVLVEAFVPRSARYFSQLGLTLCTLVAAFV
ncbi:MAG: NADH-quinone oxidoreductase subunit NuoN, partial [Angustibacter sp.]